MHPSPLIEQHRAAGARLTPPERGLEPITFGQVPAEYQAGVAGCLLFDRTERGLLRVTGADAASFLHRLLANDVRNLEPGSGRRNLLLDGKGKVQFDFDLFLSPGEEHTYELFLPRGAAAGLAPALDMYLFAEDVQIEDHSQQHAPLELTGPNAAALLAPFFGAELDATSYIMHATEWNGHGLTAYALPVAGAPGWRIDAGPDGAVELWQALLAAGAVPGGMAVHDILRVEAGSAAWGVDIDQTVYPQEALLADAFSLDKGCYIGQEVVAKIDTYGGLNKCICALRIDHDDPIAHGTRLLREIDGEWRDLGVVTSWAYSFELDTGLVLAYVKRRHQELGTTFRLGEGPAEGTIVPLPVRPIAVS